MSRMQLYELRNSRRLQGKYTISGLTTWIAPTISCPACGSRWGMVGETYPSVDVGELARLYPMKHTALSPEEFASLRDQLRKLAPKGAPLYPGVGFGPFVGTAAGRAFDLPWAGVSMVLIDQEAADAMIEHGVRLPKLVPAQLSAPIGQEGMPGTYLEPEALPIVPFSQSTFVERRPQCSICGFHSGRYDRFLIDPEVEVPEDVDMFRARNLPAIHLVTERFADAVRALDLRGSELVPVEYATSPDERTALK